MTTVGFAGMTHLGLVSATAVASRDFKTVCFDADDTIIENLRSGQIHVNEPDLEELLERNGDGQVFTSNINDLEICDVVYIAPDIPTDDTGTSDTESIRSLIDSVNEVINPNCILVVLSQVEPGFTRSLTSPDLERRYYQVETLVFGRAVERATEPERYIIGCSDPSKPIAPKLREILEAFECDILPMSFESAELAKISINFCLVSSISVANTLAEVCAKIGADWSEIVPALKLDRRIGQYSYLMPGLGIAGGNLERDLATVLRLGEKHCTDTGVIQAWKNNSRHSRDWAVRTVRELLAEITPNAKIAIWGLAYKENTHSIKNSPSLATIAQLPDECLFLHDPIVPPSSIKHPNAIGFDDHFEMLVDADILMVLTPWPVYKEADPKVIAKAMKGKIVIDPYRVFNPPSAARAGLNHYTLGCEPLAAQ